MRVEKSMLTSSIQDENEMIDAATESCDRQISTLEGALQDGALQGKAYERIRDEITTLRLPLAKAQHNVFEALRYGNDDNLTAVSALPETSPGVADTDEAQQKIDTLNHMNEGYEQQIEQAGSDAGRVRSQCQPLINANNEIIKKMQNTISKIQAYATASSGFYSEANAAMQTLAAADQSVTSYTSGKGYGNLDWVTKATGDYSDWQIAEKLGVSKEDFVKMQKEQYGFDDETAAIMWDVYRKLYETYPDKSQQAIDWMWLRFMGSASYGDRTDWNMTSGGAPLDPKDIGLSNADYEKLMRAIGDQHASAGNKKIADFAHQCITVATEYDVRSGHHSAVDLGFSGGAEERAQYAGWMGDSVLTTERNSNGRPSLGPGDYKADLDANNIATAAFRGNGSPYQAAARQYYIDLQDGTYTRANKFLNNNGGDVNVINQVYVNLSRCGDPVEGDKAALIKNPASVSGDDVSKIHTYPSPVPNGQPTIFIEYPEHSTDEQIEIIRRDDNLSDTSRFIQSLRDGDNDLP